jgi:hypothetical protein
LSSFSPRSAKRLQHQIQHPLGVEIQQPMPV